MFLLIQYIYLHMKNILVTLVQFLNPCIVFKSYVFYLFQRYWGILRKYNVKVTVHNSGSKVNYH